MNKIYGVMAGSVLAGAITGWMARTLWLWAITEDERNCADSVTICFTLYPLAGIALWILLGVAVLWLAFWMLNVRPLKTMVAAAFILQWFIIVVLAGSSRDDLPQSWALTVGAMAVGPALIALCADPARRWTGRIATGALVTTGLSLDWLSTHTTGYIL
ncbi:hypothetical protein [Streptomyces sp. NPDC048272]|uniref:hypothetical protein n=1 Tax=Streptomyces sp. NPDC048272 TaxID=3154616 RepID=UPI0034364459